MNIRPGETHAHPMDLEPHPFQQLPRHPFQQVPLHNGLIVGLTQNGKSTLLNGLGAHSGIAIAAHEGNKLESCTTRCSYHSLRLTSKSCNLFPDAKGQFNLDSFLDQANFKAHIVNHPSLEYNIGLIDTPGLDDSEGKDEYIILEIAKNVQRVGSLSCVILVVNIHTTFTSTVREKLQYYLRLLEDYNSSVIVVHTQCDPLAENYQELITQRRNFLDQQMRPINLTHFFVELKDPTDRARRPWTEHIRALRCNELNSILAHINSCPIIPATQVKITKTVRMLEHDAKVRSALDAFRASTRSTLQIVDSNLKDLVPMIDLYQSEISSGRSKLEHCEKRLLEIDIGEEKEVGSSTAKCEWGFFTWRQIAVEVTAPCPISNSRCVSDTPYTTWTRPIIDRNRVTADCESSLFRGCFGRLIALAPSRVKHQDEISRLNQLKAETSESVAKLLQFLLGLLQQKRENQEQLDKFRARIDHAVQVLDHLAAEKVSCETYMRLLSIYDNQDIGSIVDAYCNLLSIPCFLREA